MLTDMKTNKIIIAALVASVFFSCTRELEGPESAQKGVDLEFTAEWAEEGLPDSRTVLQEDGSSVWWTTDEAINVFFGTMSSGMFTSTNAEPQARVSFVGTMTSFVGDLESENPKPAYWAVYPYDEANSCDGESVSLKIAGTQTSVSGSFADKFMPAVAKSESFLLPFYNVCGGVCFSVGRPGICKVVFTSLDNSPMAGQVKVGFGEDGKPVVLDVTDPLDNIVVNSPEGGFEPGVKYYATMIPCTHSMGMKISMFTEVSKAERSIESSLTVKRSTFGVLTEIDKGLEFDSGVPVPEIVDLGLSVKWASSNLGSFLPEGPGMMLAWGEVVSKPACTWDNYKWYDDGNLCKYYDVDHKILLDSEDDAAELSLGGLWRMPLKGELEELEDNCTWEWNVINGTPGYRITSNVPGFEDKWIFLPAAGYNDNGLVYAGENGWYWAKNLNKDNAEEAYSLTLEPSYYSVYPRYRVCGGSIRPVYGEVPHVTGLNMDMATLSLTEGECAMLSVITIPAVVCDDGMTWSSSNPAVADVENGCVHAVSPGTATITATSMDGGYTADCTVIVAAYAGAPEIIDLGLSVKWAACNLGANSPEAPGWLVAWGEISTKTQYDWSNYTWGESTNSLLKYNTEYDYGSVDNKVVLDPEDDAAYRALGGSWRIPTRGEMEELLQNCIWEDATVNGVNGIRYTSTVSGYEGKSIFLPLTGFYCSSDYYSNQFNYWTSTLNVGYPVEACYCRGFDCIPEYRCYGMSVRPVYGEFSHVTDIKLNKTELSLVFGESFTLKAYLIPANASNQMVTWSSSDPETVSVSDGVVYAHAVGTATISVTSLDGGKTASCQITVKSEVPVPEKVDLGLSVKWASFNLGASRPEGIGWLLPWGAVNPQSDCSGWEEYPLYDSGITKYNDVDGKTTLEAVDDAAQVWLGGSWRMPTMEECLELIDECDWVPATFNGIHGFMVMSKKSGFEDRSIFLPNAGYLGWRIQSQGDYGYYWASTTCPEDYNQAGNFYFSDGAYYGYEARCFGQSIRPVSD